MIESIRESVVYMAHTHDGARVAMHCLWHGTAKVRSHFIYIYILMHRAYLTSWRFGCGWEGKVLWWIELLDHPCWTLQAMWAPIRQLFIYDWMIKGGCTLTPAPGFLSFVVDTCWRGGCAPLSNELVPLATVKHSQILVRFICLCTFLYAFDFFISG